MVLSINYVQVVFNTTLHSIWSVTYARTYQYGSIWCGWMSFFLTISKTKTFKKLCLPLLMMKLSLPYSFWKIYITLRPRNVRHYCRFFLQYRKYACTIQPVRKNLFGSISKTKATLLQLPIPERYEGQPARRPWVTLLMKVTLPPSNGMDDVAEGYVKDSIEKKTKKMV